MALPSAVKLGTSRREEENQSTRRLNESAGTISIAETRTERRSGSTNCKN
jgi:hypothetical protein